MIEKVEGVGPLWQASRPTDRPSGQATDWRHSTAPLSATILFVLVPIGTGDEIRKLLRTRELFKPEFGGQDDLNIDPG